jgi:hypothetical protein
MHWVPCYRFGVSRLHVEVGCPRHVSRVTPLDVETMPVFFFDLFYDRYVVLDPGGMSFEYAASASEAADEMARDLLNARSELRKSGSWIRVRDERGSEVYRSSIDPETPAPMPVVVPAA